MPKKKRSPVSASHNAAEASAVSAPTKLEPAPDKPEKEQATRHTRSDSRTTPVKESERPQSLRWPGGSWRGKASAVAGMTQSISAAASTAADTVGSKLPAPPPRRLSRSLRTPSKALACVASTTRLSVSANSQDDATDVELAKESITDRESFSVDSGAIDVGNPGQQVSASNDQNLKERPLPPPGWRGWWTKADDSTEKDEIRLNSGGVPGSSERNNATNRLVIDTSAERAKKLTERTLQTGLVPNLEETPALLINGQAPKAALGLDGLPETSLTQQRSSWFGLWGYGPRAAANLAEGIVDLHKTVISEPTPTMSDPSMTGVRTQPCASEPSEGRKTGVQSQVSGSWSFWSREQPKNEPAEDTGTRHTTELGDMAVANKPSDAIPKSARLSEQTVVPENSKDKSKKRNSAPSNRDKFTPFEKAVAIEQGGTVRPTSAGPLNRKIDTSNDTSGCSTPSGVQTPSKESNAPPKLADQVPLSTEKIVASDKPMGKKTQMQPNIILPSFRSTFQVAQTGTYWQQFLNRVGHSTVPVSRHLAISPSTPRPQHALAIGVHGLFPAPLLQKVLGPPTGTSTRFANGAAAAIQQWTIKQGYSCEVEKIVLDGEGVINDRVSTLWKLLLNFVEQIGKADLIMIACHSQGVPVSAILMAKLIDFGCIKPSARLSICAMAGTNLGPFPNYTARFLGPAANELFSFASPASLVSRSYISSLSLCLRHHVRVAYIGSIDDQLVSLESSLFATVDHPYIYRAVFVDGRIHAPDFLTHLVGFALRLRNLGVPDHGLIRELSAPLAGSLYSGEGHSRIYEEQGVYELAVAFALESTALSAAEMPEVSVKAEYEVPTAANSNPYFLPWAMRGVLEEDFVRKECKAETEDLVRLFEEWKPVTKVLKDVKFRLEAVRTQR